MPAIETHKLQNVLNKNGLGAQYANGRSWGGGHHEAHNGLGVRPKDHEEGDVRQYQNSRPSHEAKSKNNTKKIECIVLHVF